MLQRWRESLVVGVYLTPEGIILFSLGLIQTLCNPGDVFQLLHPHGELLGAEGIHPRSAEKRNFSKIPDAAEMSRSSPQPAQVIPPHHQYFMELRNL